MAGYGFNIGLDGRNVDPLTERDAEEIVGGLAEVYRQARETMLRNVAGRMARGVTQYGWAERKTSEVLDAHRQLERIYNRASIQREKLLTGVIDRAMLTGNQKFYRDMGSILGDVRHVSPNAIKAGYILNDLNNTLGAAERRILRQFNDRYADIIATASAKMATGVTNTRQAVGEALTAFADNGIDCFIDRAGHHWTMENYSEMAVLTAIERSTVSGYVDTMQSYGYDLAIIDGHAGSCPICAAWEGVIVSVSGENPDYPSLGDAENDGCFHPRCMHGISTYYPGISHEPNGGFRDEPRPIEDPGRQYTDRSKQRYCERMIRKFKDRAIVALTPHQKMQAAQKVRQWENALDNLIESQPAGSYMYRHHGREKVTKSLLKTKQSSANINRVQTGGKLTGGKQPLWMDEKRQAKRQDQADAAYSAIRKANDIAAIASASGMSEEDIKIIKDHVFFDIHKLYEGVGTLPADYDMAVAWKRLTEGKPEERDLTLLKHELIEAQAEKAGSLTLSQAHQIANERFNWEKLLEKEKGEDGEDDGLL